jgi:hypothetical protein
LAAVFVAGVLAGAAVDRVYVVRQRDGAETLMRRLLERRNAEQRRGRGTGGGAAPEVEIPSALARLDLTPDQATRIRAIAARLRPVTDSLWREVRPRAQAVENLLFQESLCVLTPDQLARWKDYQRDSDFPPEITTERLRMVTTGTCPKDSATP